MLLCSPCLLLVSSIWKFKKSFIIKLMLQSFLVNLIAKEKLLRKLTQFFELVADPLKLRNIIIVIAP